MNNAPRQDLLFPGDCPAYIPAAGGNAYRPGGFQQIAGKTELFAVRPSQQGVGIHPGAVRCAQFQVEISIRKISQFFAGDGCFISRQKDFAEVLGIGESQLSFGFPPGELKDRFALHREAEIPGKFIRDPVESEFRKGNDQFGGPAFRPDGRFCLTCCVPRFPQILFPFAQTGIPDGSVRIDDELILPAVPAQTVKLKAVVQLPYLVVVPLGGCHFPRGGAGSEKQTKVFAVMPHRNGDGRDLSDPIRRRIGQRNGGGSGPVRPLRRRYDRRQRVILCGRIKFFVGFADLLFGKRTSVDLQFVEGGYIVFPVGKSPVHAESEEGIPVRPGQRERFLQLVRIGLRFGIAVETGGQSAVDIQTHLRFVPYGIELVPASFLPFVILHRNFHIVLPSRGEEAEPEYAGFEFIDQYPDTSGEPRLKEDLTGFFVGGFPVFRCRPQRDGPLRRRKIPDCGIDAAFPVAHAERIARSRDPGVHPQLQIGLEPAACLFPCREIGVGGVGVVSGTEQKQILFLRSGGAADQREKQGGKEERFDSHGRGSLPAYS